MKRMILMFLLLVAMLLGCSDQSTDPNNDNNQSTESSADNDHTYFGIQGLEQNIENNRFKCRASMMDRTEEIWIYEAEKSEDVDIEYMLNVIKGRADLVLVKPDGSIETIVEQTDEQTDESKAEDYTSDVLHIEQGENRIKIVTSGITEFEFDITISEGEFRNLGYYY